MILGADLLEPYDILAAIAIEFVAELATLHLSLGKGCSLLAFYLPHILAFYLVLTPECSAVDVGGCAPAVPYNRLVGTHPSADACVLMAASNAAHVVAVFDSHFALRAAHDACAVLCRAYDVGLIAAIAHDDAIAPYMAKDAGSEGGTLHDAGFVDDNVLNNSRV